MKKTMERKRAVFETNLAAMRAEFEGEQEEINKKVREPRQCNGREGSAGPR